jgi:hypothetical protein
VNCLPFALALLLSDLSGLAPQARAEYFVLQNGQRLHVTSYQLLGDKYRLQMAGGFVELAAPDVAGIEPEDVFTSAPPVTAAKAPFRDLIESAAARYHVDADLITSVIAARPDAASAANRGALGRAKHLRSTRKHRRGNALLARFVAALQERSSAYLGGVQCGTTACSAVRPGSAIRRNAVLRKARRERLCQAQIGSAGRQAFHDDRTSGVCECCPFGLITPRSTVQICPCNHAIFRTDKKRLRGSHL